MAVSLWDVIREEFTRGAPSPELARGAIRLLLSAVFAGILGFEREREHKAAGLRTHMLVALGSTLAVVAAQQAGMAPADVSRVIQGVVAGIGFLGGGVILKIAEHKEVKGLTTAAGIWLVAVVGIAAGLGQHGIALLTAVLGWAILSSMRKLDRWIDDLGRDKGPTP